MTKDSKFIWNNETEDAFTNLKIRLPSTPVLRAPDFKRKSALMQVDRLGLRAVLNRKIMRCILQPVVEEFRE